MPRDDNNRRSYTLEGLFLSVLAGHKIAWAQDRVSARDDNMTI